MIVKNEERNLPKLFESIKDCFDEVVIVDTGSTDKTKQLANEFGAKVHDFTWVNSFSKARNFAFSKCTSDYIMWLDGDDCLSDREAFIKWRDHAMEFNGAWFATYHYALTADGKPIISFVRERVFRRNLNPTWNYDLHEGIVVPQEWQPQYITTWAVNHMRTIEDIKADKSRNITILEAMPDKDARMKFYYGKELYESGKAHEAIKAFEEALKCEDLQIHDRILSYQYGAYAAAQCFDRLKDEYRDEKAAYFKKGIDFCVEGIKLDTNRAELHVAMGDLHLRNKDMVKAVPCYHAAKGCIHPKSSGSAYEGAVYSFMDCYGEQPTLQLAKIYANVGMLDKAKKEAKECAELFGNEEAKKLLIYLEEVSLKTDISNATEKTDDIVISCPPNQAYPFDEEIYKKKGLGGSETALVHMARHLKRKTGRRVIVYNVRDDDLTSESGVEYVSNSKINEYFSKKIPHTHIAWRHNIKLSNAKTYLWCHDLVTQSVESRQSFDKIMCLSQFHKDYVQSIQGVSPEKIIVTRNGIDPSKFEFERKTKNQNKVVWMSSPDRGLDRSIKVMKKLREKFPELELHVYYGIENLYKYGLGQMADEFKKEFESNPWIKYHGNVEQRQMYRDVSDAVMWLHPCNFIETFCITALEMLALGVYPVTRRLGALANTLADAEKSGHAIMLNHDCITDEEINGYVAAATKVLDNKLWQGMTFDTSKHDWSKIADEWIDFMGLDRKLDEHS